MPKYIEKESLRRKMYETCSEFCPNVMCKLAEYFEDDMEDIPTVELETIRDAVVPKLEKHNIKRAYPDMTDGEVAAYILGYAEHEKLNLGHCYIDNEGYERCSICNEHETGMRYFTFCPRCGVRLKHFETEGKVLAVGLGGSFKDSLIKTEVDGLFPNF